MFACLLRKTEESEEGKRTQREDPSAQLERDGEGWIAAPDKGGKGYDARKVEMRVCPSLPGFEGTGNSV